MGKDTNFPAAIRDYEIVSVTVAGELTSVKHLKHMNTRATVKKIDKNYYIVGDESSEVRECKHTNNRQESPKSVRKTLNKLCDVINTNSKDVKCCKWLTLTYSENMTDLKKLTRDWENMRKKMRRQWGDFKYIKVKEPQGRGAWHLHVLLIFEGTAPFMPVEDLQKAWGKGFVYIKSLKNNINNGLYFTMSLRDMKVSDAEEFGIEVDSSKLSKNKKYVKGARLSLYKSVVHIFDCSEGIYSPEKKTMTKSEAYDFVKDKTQVDQYSKIIKDENGQVINVVSNIQYREKETYTTQIPNGYL